MRGLLGPYGVDAAGFLALSTVFTFRYDKYLDVPKIYDITCTHSTFFDYTREGKTPHRTARNPSMYKHYHPDEEPQNSKKTAF